MTRALVLSGGGSVGIAWQTGLVAGLAAKGVDVGGADCIIGTSAGSAVGAQIALGHDLGERYESYLSARPATPSPPGARSSGSSVGSPERMKKLMEVMAAASEPGADPMEARAAIGRFALEADTPPEDRFIAGFSYLAGSPWPDPYRCTTVDAETGAFVVWDRDNPAPLERAVAASCAVPGLFPPITIDGRRYIDGGMRSGANADLAQGHDRVLLVSLMSPARLGSTADPRAARYRERAEREERVLTESGSTLHVVGPDEAASAVIGMNLMDGRLAPDAAAAGFRQGEAMAGDIAAYWD